MIKAILPLFLAAALLSCTSFVSSDQRKFSAAIEQVDHAEIRNKIIAASELIEWDIKPKLYQPSKAETRLPIAIPEQLEKFDPWVMIFYPDGPKRIEFGFWVPSDDWVKRNVGLIYVLSDELMEEGRFEENVRFGDQEVTAKGVAKMIARGVYAVEQR